MDSQALVVIAFGLGTAGNLAKGVPQFARTAVRGRVNGLSAGAVWLALIANMLWAAFGAAISDLAFLALSLFGSILTASTAVRFAARTGWKRNRAFIAGTALAAIVFLALAIAGADQVLAAGGVALGLVISLPQLVHLLRIRGTNEDVSGVSGWEYTVVIAAQIGWTTYWLLNAQWLVAAGAAWGGIARVTTLMLLLRHAARARARARHESPTDVRF